MKKEVFFSIQLFLFLGLITSCDLIEQFFPDNNNEKITLLDSIFGTTDNRFGCQAGLVFDCTMESYMTSGTTIDTIFDYMMVFPYLETVVQNEAILGTVVGEMKDHTYTAEYDTMITFSNSSNYMTYTGSFEIKFNTNASEISEMELIGTTKHHSAEGTIYYEHRITVENIPFINAENGKANYKITGSTTSSHIVSIDYEETYYNGTRRVLIHHWSDNSSLIHVVLNKP
jgi:hypothetical protein